MPKTLSGSLWVSKFPTSTSVDDLEATFRSNVKNFLSALKTAGASVSIAATLRPKERAYLMHWSYGVANEGVDPSDVPAMAGVDIEWVHTDKDGKKNIDASKLGAKAMVDGYGIAFRPALTSRHTEGKAIDMDISWTSAELKIKDGGAQDVVIKTGNKDGSNTQLHTVGKSYGVIKLVTDPPHWSSDGH